MVERGALGQPHLGSHIYGLHVWGQLDKCLLEPEGGDESVYVGNFGLKNGLEGILYLRLRCPPIHNKHYGVILLYLGRVFICLNWIAEKVTRIVPRPFLNWVARIERRLLVNQGLGAEEVNISPYLLGLDPRAFQNGLLGLQCLRFLGHVSPARDIRW